MSVSSSLQQSTRTHGAEPDDSAEEEEWEIGVGDLIIDLDADLEKDRQTSEMNRVLSVKSAVEGREELDYKCATGRTFDGLSHEQPFLCKESKKFKLKRRNSGNDRFASVEIVSGIPKVCVGKRREAQGRVGGGGDMSSAPSPTDSSPEAAPARPKDGKKGKNKAVRREKEATKTRKEKPSDEFGGAENGSAFGGAEGLVGRGGMDAAAIVDDAEEHSLRTVSTVKKAGGKPNTCAVMAGSMFGAPLHWVIPPNAESVTHSSGLFDMFAVRFQF